MPRKIPHLLWRGKKGDNRKTMRLPHLPPLMTLIASWTLSGLAAQNNPLDLVLRSGTVIDGTGAKPFQGDIGIRGGMISEIGDLSKAKSERVIDASGLVIAPGFIDTHAHADNIGSRPEAQNFLAMGVTTIVSGNCGSSNLDIAKHFTQLDKTGISLNYATLIGHGTVRNKVLGRENRPPDDRELENMKSLVRDAMRAGAVGMSTGLIYVPGTYAKTNELIELTKAVSEFDGLYASHMRNESKSVLKAIEEALTIGREAKVPVHLSHLKASGKNVWGDSEKMIAKLRAARAAGMRLTGDQYAYTASSTGLQVLFPASMLTIGQRAFAEKLGKDPAFRRNMREAVLSKAKATGFDDLSYCRIGNAPNNTDLNGMTIAEATQLRMGKKDPDSQGEMALRLFEASRGSRVSMIYHKMTESDVEAIMKEDYVSVACDAGIRLRKGLGKPHPRGAGNNPRVLGHYVRERATLPLAKAIRKMTQLPAKTFGLEGRGVIRIGAHADLTLFDPQTVKDRATFKEPRLEPEGIPFVIVNGVVVIDDGNHTRARPGHILRHKKVPAK